ncbi:hypothetical protein [Halocynthiibacter namhaensis]|uniref:hypothetical protein n=1 Tax=Halocynthiibacter namhaensis TaxID=1290553 RepID=UPI00057936CB|nr:hypothetical protein [Halocynthiibacter namhaensis]
MRRSHWLFHTNAKAAQEKIAWRLLLALILAPVIALIVSIVSFATIEVSITSLHRNFTDDAAIIYGISMVVQILSFPIMFFLFRYLFRHGRGGLSSVLIVALLGGLLSQLLIHYLGASLESIFFLRLSETSVFFIALLPFLLANLFTWLLLRVFHKALFQPEPDTTDVFS